MTSRTDTEITMHYGSAWKDRPTQLKNVPNTCTFQVEVKNTWSKEMRLDVVKLHIKGLNQADAIMLNIYNSEGELVCYPRVDTNNHAAGSLTPDRIRTSEFRMERDIRISAGGTCLLSVNLTDPVGTEVRAELWNDYLAYSARMSEICVYTSEGVEKELASLRNEIQILSTKTLSRDTESKANAQLLQKLVGSELQCLSQGSKMRADLLLQALEGMHQD
jgi:hypothetical protein